MAESPFTSSPVTSSPTEAWFRTIRPINLIIIGVAIFILRHRVGTKIEWDANNWWIDFLFVAPIVLIAAGGNLINDYFDIREDRINKPRKALVGRVLKRRVAVFSHWTLSLLGIGLAGLLSKKIHTPTPLLIAIGLTVLLWLYSTRLKGKVLVGNFAIGFAVASVVPWSFFSKIHSQPEFQTFLGIAALTIFIVVMREIVKDVQDVNGDLIAGHKTLPVVYGRKFSWKLIHALTILLIVFSGIMVIYDGVFITHIVWIAMLLGISFFSYRKKASALSAWLKLLLAAGLFWISY